MPRLINFINNVRKSITTCKSKHGAAYHTGLEKTCLRDFRLSEFQTSLLSYIDFACSKFSYGTFKKANNKGADQTARMRRLVCACVVRKPPKTGFLATRPKCKNDTFCYYLSKPPLFRAKITRHQCLLYQWDNPSE